MQMELLRCLTLLIIVLATATACRVCREGVEDEELVNKRDGEVVVNVQETGLVDVDDRRSTRAEPRTFTATAQYLVY